MARTTRCLFVGGPWSGSIRSVDEFALSAGMIETVLVDPILADGIDLAATDVPDVTARKVTYRRTRLVDLDGATVSVFVCDRIGDTIPRPTIRGMIADVLAVLPPDADPPPSPRMRRSWI